MELTETQRATLEAIAKSIGAADREVLRVRVLLIAANGTANSRTAEQVGVSVPTAREWRARFAAEGLAKFAQVRKGRGRKPEIPQARIDEMVDLTQYYRPEGQKHWSCRSMAKATGVSAPTVQRVWSSRGLTPHLVETFQESLPMKKGRAGAMTHDYKGTGTITLFAALDVLSGKVIGQCLR